MTQVKVGINGDGVIDKRLADAIRVQPDMTLAGVVDVAADYRTHTANVLGIAVYTASEGSPAWVSSRCEIQ